MERNSSVVLCSRSTGKYLTCMFPMWYTTILHIKHQESHIPFPVLGNEKFIFYTDNPASLSHSGKQHGSVGKAMDVLGGEVLSMDSRDTDGTLSCTTDLLCTVPGSLCSLLLYRLTLLPKEIRAIKMVSGRISLTVGLKQAEICIVWEVFCISTTLQRTQKSRISSLIK